MSPPKKSKVLSVEDEIVSSDEEDQKDIQEKEKEAGQSKKTKKDRGRLGLWKVLSGILDGVHAPTRA